MKGHVRLCGVFLKYIYMSLWWWFQILMDSGEDEEAEECYQKVIELSPSNGNAYNNLGVFFNKRSKCKLVRELSKLRYKYQLTAVLCIFSTHTA